MEFTQTEWKGYKRLDFVFEGRKACLVLPNEPCAGGHWMLKTEYFGAFPAFEKEMLARGWHLAWIANLTRWHHEEDDAFITDKNRSVRLQQDRSARLCQNLRSGGYRHPNNRQRDIIRSKAENREDGRKAYYG